MLRQNGINEAQNVHPARVQMEEMMSKHLPGLLGTLAQPSTGLPIIFPTRDHSTPVRGGDRALSQTRADRETRNKGHELGPYPRGDQDVVGAGGQWKAVAQNHAEPRL